MNTKSWLPIYVSGGMSWKAGLHAQNPMEERPCRSGPPPGVSDGVMHRSLGRSHGCQAQNRFR
jgi:hypothetical protein